MPIRLSKGDEAPRIVLNIANLAEMMQRSRDQFDESAVTTTAAVATVTQANTQVERMKRLRILISVGRPAAATPTPALQYAFQLPTARHDLGTCYAMPGGPDPLTPLVKRMDVVGRGVFANNHSACLCAELLMNRYRHTVPIDFDQESLQFEIVAQCFV